MVSAGRQCSPGLSLHVVMMTANTPFLSEADGAPFEVINPDGASRVVLVCEHASNRVPERLGNLGLTSAQLESHVAWDPGARELALGLTAALDAPLAAARFSRLVYDCNRPPQAVSAMPHQTEVCEIPGNREITPRERGQRAAALYKPFQGAVRRLIDARRAAEKPPVLVTIHSFTPVFHGVRRDVEIGFLHGEDASLAQALATDCSTRSTYDVRLNEPYAPKDGVLHTIEHQLENGPFPYVMVEVRNDLLTDPEKRSEIQALLVESLRATYPDI